MFAPSAGSGQNEAVPLLPRQAYGPFMSVWGPESNPQQNKNKRKNRIKTMKHSQSLPVTVFWLESSAIADNKLLLRYRETKQLCPSLTAQCGMFELTNQ